MVSNKKNAAALKNTGERMIPEFSKGQSEYGEHMVRYEACLEIVKNRVVLDIASGSGYGTAMLSKSAKKVYGVDYDKDAIHYAQATYKQSNTTFIQGSATDIPLVDKSVDVVVSFETLEHIKDYRKFMQEIKRILKDDGLLVLSTPNDKEFPEGAHFHIHEFKQKELEHLVKNYFTKTKSYFQATWVYNTIFDEAALKTNTSINIPTLNLAPISLDKTLYFYMLCSNRQITESITPVAAISEHWSKRDILEHNAAMDAYIKDIIKHYERMIKTKDKQSLRLHDEVTHLSQQTNSQNEEIKQLQQQLKEFKLIRDSKKLVRWAKRKTSQFRTGAEQ